MHSDVTSQSAGFCPRCGMALVDSTAVETKTYRLELSTSPAAIEPGSPFTLTLVVKHPETGATISAFELVHEMWFHLFIVSRDMTVFQHVHPDMRPDGTWTVELVLPADGVYGVLADFVPVGGAPQMISGELMTVRADATAAPALLPDPARERTVDGISAELVVDPAPIVSGALTHLTYRLTDATTGDPIVDLQPYLGAFGHTLVVRDGLSAYIHSHPSGDDARLSRPRPRGGPEVTFDAYFDHPGRYRVWTQFQRNGQVSTVAFTLDVVESKHDTHAH